MISESETALPLVINTQGWVKGLGADLLTEIHRLADPSVIFDFVPVSITDGPQHEVSTAYKAFKSHAQVISLQPISLPEHSVTRLTASDGRTLHIISYLHLTSVGLKSSPSWDFSQSLLAKRPFVVPFGNFHDIQVLGSEQVCRGEILRALDISIIALLDAERGEDELDSKAETDQAKIAYDPSRGAEALSGTCLGLAVIRSIDSAARQFHILSPLPPQVLARTTVMHKGDIELPTVLLLDYANDSPSEEGLCGIEWRHVPYLEGRDEVQPGVGAARRRVRRNVMRRRYFR